MNRARENLVDASTLLAGIVDPDLRLFDCRFSLADPDAGRRAYAEGHLPGAAYADLDAHLSSPIGANTGRHPLPDPASLADWLGKCGVSATTRVVVYDDAGGGFAVRLWWLLRWIGHDRVALLDGGLQAWIAAGGTLTRAVHRHEPAELIARPEDTRWITTEALAAELAADPTGGRLTLIDARAPERFRGEQEPIDPVAGHIPGAINLPLTENLDADGRFLSADRLRERFTRSIGQAPPSSIVHSCGSGVNACHNLLAMELAGLHGSRLYAGSWSEWIRSPERSVATGSD
ncbi:sulfurtransferase [Thiocapsa marina]|uniref:3-mercaptopyruvate sulfurtransferase n=1 Tax=Thiocapsa marina 5811 TaxID=768671 RepID=F9U7H5_9GAMM|nr:sulfurtransferase [Thiocapsa marina]EGV20201.1 3-mercaptopyruvate sulfurtransferase [Thiocapsa marina 5811]